MKKFLTHDLSKYLSKNNPPIDGVEYYLNIEWLSLVIDSVIIDWLDKNNIRYILKADDLPKGAGIYIMGYDGVPEKIQELRDKEVPLIEKPCPWVRNVMKTELEKVTAKYQCILLLEKTHIQYKNYQNLIPADAIFVNLDNYKEKLKDVIFGKPIYFIVYSTYRMKDAAKIIDYIEKHHHNPDNIYFTKSICSWATRQGILEEIEQSIKQEKLTQIWIICNDERNRSVKSLINEVNENGALPVIVKTTDDIPRNINNNDRIGVLIAPIPYHKEDEIISEIKKLYG